MAEWLLQRLFDAGHQSTPRFAVQSTLNWMRALAILVTEREFTSGELHSRYSDVTRRNHNADADTRAFECLLMAMHNVSALNEFSTAEQPYNIVRAAIVAWYYTVYESATAMTLAASGNSAESHAGTARIWHSDIVERGWAVGPFGLNVDTLVVSDVKAQVDKLRNGSNFRLVDSPDTYDDAWGAACGYLSGTAEYEKAKIEERLRNSKEFEFLGFGDFRKKDARELRDNKLKNRHVNFLVQAFRYRGKANYRDSIYLSYGGDRTAAVSQFLKDLFVVGCVFLRMARHYVSRRVSQDCWQHFVVDLGTNCQIHLVPETISDSGSH